MATRLISVLGQSGSWVSHMGWDYMGWGSWWMVACGSLMVVGTVALIVWLVRSTSAT